MLEGKKKKRSFYTVGFPSAVGRLSSRPCTRVPDVCFAREALARTLPCWRDLQARAREREAEGRRHPPPPPCTRAPQVLAHTPPSSPPRQLPARRTCTGNRRKSAPGPRLPRSGKRQVLGSHVPFSQDARSLRGPCPSPLPPPAAVTPGKARAPVSCCNTSCNSNDKVITET